MAWAWDPAGTLYAVDLVERRIALTYEGLQPSQYADPPPPLVRLPRQDVFVLGGPAIEEITWLSAEGPLDCSAPE